MGYSATQNAALSLAAKRVELADGVLSKVRGTCSVDHPKFLLPYGNKDLKQEEGY